MLFNKNNAVQKNWRMVKKGKQIVFGCTLFFAGGLALAAPAQASDQTAKAEATAVVAADNSASQGDITSKEVESTQPKAESKETAAPKEASATEKAVVSEKAVVDKSKLESILLQAKELKLVGKSSEAVAELEKAIKEAELLLTKENATQEEINSSVVDLTKVLDKVKAERATSANDKKSAEEAAEKARANHFIEALPNSYDFEINEEASNLSNGEKQLITIARAILADKPILILDEATSSIDTRTEILVQNAMNKLMENRTTFVIAHRLSTIKNADTILVLKDGNIIEQGNHEELLEKRGFYFDLYNSQFQEV